MTEKILARIKGYRSLSNGDTRFALDVDKSRIIKFLSDIGIPNGDDEIPVWISSAEHPEPNPEVPEQGEI